MDEWTRAEQIFLEVLELPEDEQTSYLQEACAGDAALAERVRRLLAADAPSSIPCQVREAFFGTA